MTTEFGPAQAVIAFWRWFWVVVGVLVLVGAFVLIMWQAGWWFAGQNAGREAHLIRNGYSNQQTLREQITTQIATVDGITTQIAATTDTGLISALKAQRMAIAATVCQDAAEVSGDPLPAQQAEWAAANCQAGTVRPGSTYYQAGTP
jgi:hypothetical protein